MNKILGRAAMLTCLVVVAAEGRSPAEDQSWRISGQFLEFRPEDPDVVVLELADGSRFEVPLAAFSEGDRQALAALGKSENADGPGEPVVPDKGKAAEMVKHSIDLLRLGNPQLAKQELQQASKADPESGDADFVMGTIYAIATRNYAKAADHFEKAMQREPDNAATVANLAVCELYAKQYTSAVTHFRRAIELNPQGQAIADNMALAIRAAGAGRARISEKPLAELNELYRAALSDQKLVPLAADSPPALVLYGLDGRAVDPKSPTPLLDAVRQPAGEPVGGVDNPKAIDVQPSSGSEE
jgi:tetratricopeptide (TPR) repeat protein